MIEKLSESKGLSPFHLLPKSLEEALEKNPLASFRDLKKEFLDRAPAQGKEFDQQQFRSALEKRLDQLSNPYHNKSHAEEVEQRTIEFLGHAGLMEGREKTLIIEAARRHDDDHSGLTYRQLKGGLPGKNLSNEEWAVLLLMADHEALGSPLSKADLELMERHILATSFGQTKPPQEMLFRDYAPNSKTEKILALADVGGFRNGWERWVDESFRVLEEGTGAAVPADIDAWLKTRIGFTKFYVLPLLQSLKDSLDTDFYNTLDGELGAIIQKIEVLQRGESPEEKMTLGQRLEEIRKSKG